MYLWILSEKKLADCRKEKNLSQKDLAKIFKTSHTTIGKYERDEMIPSFEAAKKLANILDTTVGYLLGKTEQDLFKDIKMLQRLKDLTIWKLQIYKQKNSI
ncbi:MAG: helix-turn-helix transcriptional regulator [Bacteroidota bacterium]|nr:helix-turn-helix transcriptional regulator [Bacteroidota bacterium]